MSFETIISRIQYNENIIRGLEGYTVWSPQAHISDVDADMVDSEASDSAGSSQWDAYSYLDLDTELDVPVSRIRCLVILGEEIVD